jgi:predicted TIM-barrel fold metal-dependent hydrolase
MGFDALDAYTASSLARDINDELAEAVRSHPTRFGRFATLALKAPATAAAELERCITRLGFHGALLDGTTDGLFLDDPRFLPVFEAAAQLILAFPSISTPRRRHNRYARPIIPAFPVDSASFSLLRAGATR